MVSLQRMRWLLSLSEEYFAHFLLVTPLTWRRSPKLSMFQAAAAAIAFEGDQLVTQAVAAREEEVSV